ncbi:TPA: tetratricopeptide repeat protein [Legionella pneumophila]
MIINKKSSAYRTIRIIFLLSFILLASSVTYSEDVKGSNKENYSSELQEIQTLAEKGNPGAQFNLGVMYRKGQSVPQNYILSYMWYFIAGTNGDKDAMKDRNKIAKNMTKSQIEKAQLMAQEWLKKHRQ